MFRAYALSWPGVSQADASSPSWGSQDDYAHHLLGRAERIGSYFPEYDLWDEHLPSVLEDTMKAYDPK